MLAFALAASSALADAIEDAAQQACNSYGNCLARENFRALDQGHVGAGLNGRYLRRLSVRTGKNFRVMLCKNSSTAPN